MPLREPAFCANKEDSADPSHVFLWTLVVLGLWGDPLKCHKNFGHSLRLYFNVFASPSKGWGLGKGTAFESPSPDSPVEARSSFSPFPSFTINCTVAPRESAGCPRSLCCSNSSGGR